MQIISDKLILLSGISANETIKNFSKFIGVIIFAFSLPLSAFAQTVVCDGDCHSGGVELSGTPEAMAGAPAGSVWATGTTPGAPGAVNPQIWESDPGPGNDDAMGDGSWHSTSPPQTKGEVCNNGGDLSGPNGDVQNGGLEGDCIEVYMKIPIWVPTYEAGVIVSWDLDWVETKAKVVCPGAC